MSEDINEIKNKSVIEEFPQTPLGQLMRFFDKRLSTFGTLVLMGFATLVRLCVGLNGYSGAGTPPQFGDFEAQRHWMELTLHLPVNQWYFFDLKYWGLDYPPLTAYVSLLWGYIANWINPEWTALNLSRGIETDNLKVFMRISVILTELVTFYIPVWLYWKLQKNHVLENIGIGLTILSPGFILIDHGHFQYNCVMLGFTLWSVYYFHKGKDLLGSIMFCLALTFKQMALYYALPIFCYLLGKCIRMRSPLLLIKIGFTVILTMALMFSPFLFDKDQIKQVFIRIFPLARGLYEDKVANIWCTLNVVVKLRTLFSIDKLAKLSAISTLLASLPSLINLLINPHPKRLIYSLSIVSLSFFLLSFQVHEKTILLPLLPITMLTVDERKISQWFTNVATFSMFPLLKKDGLILPYFQLIGFYNWLKKFPNPFKAKLTLVDKLELLTYAIALSHHIMEYLVTPPKSLPDLFTVLNVIFSCGQFVGIWIYLNYRQFTIKFEEVNFNEMDPKVKTD